MATEIQLTLSVVNSFHCYSAFRFSFFTILNTWGLVWFPISVMCFCKKKNFVTFVQACVEKI